ncbi:MAG: hypothetical protein R8K47_08910 [Mariprofundaceae bacterium]
MRTRSTKINAQATASHGLNLTLDIPAEHIETVLEIHREIVRHLEENLRARKEAERLRAINAESARKRREKHHRMWLKLARLQRSGKITPKGIAKATRTDIDMTRRLLQNARAELDERRRCIIHQAIIDAWIAGLGVREISRTLTARFGKGASAPTVSRVIRAYLDQHAPKLPMRILHIVK